MDYTERLTNVTVLGAAGKMGSGILLLVALEMADLKLKPGNEKRNFVLNAMDISSEALPGLMKYLRSQVLKAAEKKSVLLRQLYANRHDLIENSEIIEAYVNEVLELVRPVTRIEAAYDSFLVFEAVAENPELKVRMFRQIDSNNTNKPLFFTNTSSIPIGGLNTDAGLEGRILGFHFYNPPAVQKLVELITIPENSEEMVKFAEQLASNLRKIVVRSNDVAGFIGNGHFMRDALYGIEQAMRLAKDMPLHEAIYAINKIGQDYLMRPMGIFQLIDYVGIDVVRFIMMVMNPYMKDENLHSQLLDDYYNKGIKGGQNADGTQKNGFFRYEKGRPTAVYSMDKEDYIPFTGFAAKTDEWLGLVPSVVMPWKNLVRSANRNAIVETVFAAYKKCNDPGCQLALDYARRSREIGRKLLEDHVALSSDDVNTVLMTGFFHAYGPINEFVI
ncbi:MAG: 3-hydroxyacyl-CoA dehydrogenase family protein [Lentimicrobiaceae bacterium]|nr:3-hydroxyacyl-CoA dehydrogenase family protein [Lentimicrobiaceae bacterium]